MTGAWSLRFHCCPATSRRSSRQPFIPRLCGPQRMSPRGKQSIMVSTALVRQGQRAPLFRYRRRMVARRARAQYAILARAIWGRPLRLRPLSTTDMNTTYVSTPLRLTNMLTAEVESSNWNKRRKPRQGRREIRSRRRFRRFPLSARALRRPVDLAVWRLLPVVRLRRPMRLAHRLRRVPRWDRALPFPLLRWQRTRQRGRTMCSLSSSPQWKNEVRIKGRWASWGASWTCGEACLFHMAIWLLG